MFGRLCFRRWVEGSKLSIELLLSMGLLLPLLKMLLGENSLIFVNKIIINV